jgi:hypothetical protein
MTTMTLSRNGTSDPDNSWENGRTDGELAAMTNLPESRARARAEMAEDHDQLYAAGYWDGYETTVILLDSLAETASR